MKVRRETKIHSFQGYRPCYNVSDPMGMKYCL